MSVQWYMRPPEASGDAADWLHDHAGRSTHQWPARLRDAAAPGIRATASNPQTIRDLGVHISISRGTILAPPPPASSTLAPSGVNPIPTSAGLPPSRA